MLPQLIRGRALALLRSSRFLGTDDLLFLIRHNRAQIARLRHYLAWKDVRKKTRRVRARRLPRWRTWPGAERRMRQVSRRDAA